MREADAERAAVAIIGGGPAGAMAALLLARAGISTALIESLSDEDETASADWKIGEGLPPLARPLLQRHGLWERFLAAGHLPSYGNCAAWGGEQMLDHSFIFDPHGHGWHLNRRRFDQMLREQAAAAGALCYRGAPVANARRAAEHWQLELASSSAWAGRGRLEARFVVDASGRSSWFARRQGARRVNEDGLVALVALLAPADDLPVAEPDCDSLTMVEAAADGWWYASLLAGGDLVVAYLSDGDLAATKAARDVAGWLRLLEQTKYLASRVARHCYRVRRGPRIVSANSSRLDRVMGEGWVAVGDAALAYDPLSSQGILAALETGAQAAEAIQACLQGDGSALETYTQNINQHWKIYLDSLRFFYGQERRWPASPFWQRRRTLL